jgi:patatin-like phospholipase/acyl hydrolase
MAGVQPLKILSLDGGGVRGIATLYLLRGLMHQIALSTDQNPESLRPCDYFDLIAGTSTGGLIAIMLGRLRYVSTQNVPRWTTS